MLRINIFEGSNVTNKVIFKKMLLAEKIRLNVTERRSI